MPAVTTPTVKSVARACVLAVLASAWVGLTATVSGRFPAATLTLALCVAGLVVAAIVEWGRWKPPSRGELRSRLRAAGAGALGLFLAPFMVLANRFTDAPPGSEYVWLISAGWGTIATLAVAVALWRQGRRRAALVLPAGAFAGLVGCAGVLANWERPSSFSPFVHFALQETLLLVAGVVFLAGAHLLSRALEHGDRAPYLTAAITATVLAAITLVLSGAGFERVMLAGSPPVVAVWAVVGAAFWFTFNRRASEGGLVMPAAMLFTPALLLPALSGLERALGISGVNPIVWDGVLGGSLLAWAGIARILVHRSTAGGVVDALRSVADRAVGALAVVATALAAAALAMPALTARVTGHRPQGNVDISWTLLGVESVAVLAALALAILLVAAVLDDARLPAFAGIAAAPAFWLLARTPTHVWTTRLDPDIQGDYGTEYAQIAFRAITSWPAQAAVLGAVVGLAVVLTRRVISERRTRAALRARTLEEGAS